MPRPYRAPNKRLIYRSGSGQFRKATLREIGLAECAQCRGLFTPAFPDRPMLDPRDFQKSMRFCPTCQERQ
jgi:hypothetical protein